MEWRTVTGNETWRVHNQYFDKKYTTLQRATLIEFLKDPIYSQHLRFGKKIKEVTELKEKILIKFEDNTNDLVDFVVGADGIFSNTRSFFEKKKNEPKYKKALRLLVWLFCKKVFDFCYPLKFYLTEVGQE